MILYRGCGPSEYAKETWEELTNNAIMRPLWELLSHKDLEEKIKPAYLEKTAEMGRMWATREGIANPCKMLWVKAIK